MGFCTAEPLNALSSLAFVAAGIIGLVRRAGARPAACVVAAGKRHVMWCDVLVVATGAGSFAFHAAGTHFIQVLDEVPLALLLAAYMALVHHAAPPGGLRRLAGSPVNRAVALAWLLVYQLTGCFLAFEALLTVQGGLLMAMALHTVWERPWDRVLLAAGLASFVVGKVLWDVERRMYASGTCPTTGPGTWLHASWHIFGAAMHVLFVLWGEGEVSRSCSGGRALPKSSTAASTT